MLFRHQCLSILIMTLLLLTAGPCWAFCGFYVAKADTSLFNEASKVVLMRNGERTVITMANDYRGELKEFALVVPVPVVLQEGQIHVSNNAIVDHLDAYTAPRLVEYFDPDPCMMREFDMMMRAESVQAPMPASAAKGAASLGVKIEAEYTVGEYDIQILSATQSDGLSTYLTQNGYRLPNGAENVLGSYIRQGTRFFVARVNLEEQAKTGLQFLRPLQIAFESPRFMLPIRLGMLNANGKQELFVFALTQSGRIETTNYRTVKLPTGMDIPPYIKNEFGDFYRDMFHAQVKKENETAVFLEYAWDMNWCDPCAADPLSVAELRELGVYWVEQNQQPNPRLLPRRPKSQARNVYVTRLHLSYDQAHFPEDLMFKETGNRENFQGRYVLRHAFKGEASCPAGDTYRQSLPKRFEQQARTLAQLTGRNINEIRDQMKRNGQDFEPVPATPWWKSLWSE